MKRAIPSTRDKQADDCYGEFPVCREAGIWQLKNKL